MDLDTLLNNIRLLNEYIIVKRLVVMLIYAIFAKGADIFVDRVLRRWAARTRISFDDQLIGFLHTPICWTLVWLGVLHALVLPPQLHAPWQTILPPLAKSLLLVTWLVAAIRMLNRLAEKNMAAMVAKGKVGLDIFQLLKNVIRVVVIVAGILWLLAIWRVDLTPLFASAGIAGIAVALAAKDTLANFFGGISIFMDNTYRVGDYVILESGERGEVVTIGIRSTRIKTRDDVLITIPNSLMANSKIINESAPIPRFRIRVPVGVAYGSDLDRVEEIILAVAKANPAISTELEPRVRLRTFADSSVNFELLCWVEEPSLKGLETHRLLKGIYSAFGREGIVIPFPQRDVHLCGRNTADVPE